MHGLDIAEHIRPDWITTSRWQFIEMYICPRTIGPH